MRYAIVLLLLIAALVAIWWFDGQREREPDAPLGDSVSEPALPPEPRFPLPAPEPRPEPAVPAPVPDQLPEPEESVEPIESAEVPEPLPEPAQSDDAAIDNLSALFGGDFVERWVQSDWVISRIVVMVHSLDGAAPAVEARPLALIRAAPQIRPEGEETLYWTDTTARRYADLVSRLESVSPAEAGERYRRYYPLFQQAWEELGEAEPYFNDRLVDIIDHLLATPRVELPVEIVAWENRFKFASEALESESWGRKLLIRLGPDQADRVRDWLGAFRRDITGHIDD